MNGFEEWRMLAQRRRGLQAHRTCDTRGLIGEDVSKGVFRHDDIEETGFCEYAHRGIVDKHIIGGNLRILGFHLFGNLAPQTTRSQHVGLIDHGEVFLAGHRHLEGYLQDALNLRTCVDIGIVGLIVVLILLAKVHTTREFANHHEISATQQFILQG